MKRTVQLGDATLTFVGQEAQLGQQLELKGAKAGDFAQSLATRSHDYAVLAVFPSSNTSVCDMQILELSKISETYPNFDYITFSVDLPSALADYKNLHPTGKVELYSDYYNHYVAKQLGLLIEEIHLMGRAMFILDKENKIIYKQINSQVKEQVDFASLKNELEKLS
ncbi:thiol peroxidase [Mycoplasmopsis columbina SF7]|uniref:Thiol peroxidase n=1 Tax=Mycoplasmopsis columbina SF7 TaxID=1037410 RepID=F9UK77_9BACT|nr:redoxin domain-containing protein [Mycoplasmopsis columbina]EGV00082.1 thiol peroxidase [Mycoplasmopsis columbina SF7]